ncbi:MAG: hypothetical protein WAW36_18860 [Methylovulum miyakonense]|uniref:hypothetical protein n=1 Tax=Methylovulum miyakonense TaxID=645578 RepID=UPI003BB57EC8
MPYTPLPGHAVGLTFDGAYQPPLGGGASLNFVSGIGSAFTEFAGVLDGLVGYVPADSSAIAVVEGVLESSASQLSGQFTRVVPAGFYAVLQDTSVSFSATQLQAVWFDAVVGEVSGGWDSEYRPATRPGDHVVLRFLAAYQPPVGDKVNLVFAPLAIEGALEPVTGGWSAASDPPARWTAHTGSVAGFVQVSTVSFAAFSGGSLWLESSALPGTSSPPSLLVPETEGVVGAWSAQFLQYYLADVRGVLDGIPATDGMACLYDPLVWRGQQASVTDVYGCKRLDVQRGYTGRVASGVRLREKMGMAFKSRVPGQQAIGSRWRTTVILPRGRAIPYQDTADLTLASVLPFRSPPRKHQSRLFKFQPGSAKQPVLAFVLEQAEPRPRPVRFQEGVATPFANGVNTPFGASGYKDRRVRIVWQKADPHPWWPLTVYRPPPIYGYDRSTGLVFYQPALDYYGGANLVFGHPCYAWPIGLQRRLRSGVTVLVHTIRVTRWPDGTNIPASAVSLQFDGDSWGWSATVTLKTAAAVDLVKPVNGDPRTLEISIDGFQVHVLAEDILPDRRFGGTVWQVQCRSPLALFSALYAPLRTRLVAEPMVAAQLVDLELANTGWTAQYHGDLNQLFAIDWLVPANVWGYQSQSPLDAILQIAGAVGARAYSDNTANVLHIAPRYPVSPWDWATSALDKTIPSSLVRFAGQRLGNKPAYNQVYVAGQQGGVLVNAVRSGTSGDIRADMVVDKLITTIGAGRERARNIISSGGKQYVQTLELPINVQTGVVHPGQLVGFEDVRGLGVGVSIEASISDNAVQAAQTVEVRVHL